MSIVSNVMRRLSSDRSRGTKKPKLGNLNRYAEQIEIPGVSGASGMSVRTRGTRAHVENEFNEYADEQFDKHEANGVRESRSAREQAAAVDYRAREAEARVEANKPRLEAAQADRDHAVHWLLPFTHRPAGGHRLYLMWFAVLMLGDAAGVFGASVMWGELIPVATGQALASGAAAVAAGWVGADVRERRDADTRARMATTGDLPDDLVGRYPSLFIEPGHERSTYKLTLVVALVIVICLGSAIFALRTAVEGSTLAGFMFGGLAAATALGSFVNSWRHADAIADLLDRVDQAYRVALGEHERLLADPAPGQRDAALMSAERIETQHLLLASAAKHGVLALLHGVLRRNPQVFGHGVIEGTQEPPRMSRAYADAATPAMPSDERDSQAIRNGHRPLAHVDGHRLD